MTEPEPPKMSFDAILMASGFSLRFGAKNKLLHPFMGRPLASWTLELVCGMPEFSKIILVTAGEDVASLADGRVRIVRNCAPERGICESIRLGVLESDARHYCFFPCDQPLLTASAVRKLLIRAKPGMIVEPVIDGVPRSPSVFSESFRDELISLSDGSSDASVKECHRDSVIRAAFDDPEIFEDIDTTEALKRAQDCRCTEIDRGGVV